MPPVGVRKVRVYTVDSSTSPATVYDRGPDPLGKSTLQNLPTRATGFSYDNTAPFVPIKGILSWVGGTPVLGTRVTDCKGLANDADRFVVNFPGVASGTNVVSLSFYADLPDPVPPGFEGQLGDTIKLTFVPSCDGDICTKTNPNGGFPLIVPFSRSEILPFSTEFEQALRTTQDPYKLEPIVKKQLESDKGLASVFARSDANLKALIEFLRSLLAKPTYPDAKPTFITPTKLQDVHAGDVLNIHVLAFGDAVHVEAIALDRLNNTIVDSNEFCQPLASEEFLHWFRLDTTKISRVAGIERIRLEIYSLTGRTQTVVNVVPRRI